MPLLRRAGVELSADRVDPDRLAAALTAPIAGPLEWLPEVGSTNEVLAARARDGAPEGAVLGADHQTAGRGRLGRTWQDVPGRALAISVLLRPPPPLAAHPGMLSLALATAVAEGVGAEALVAWPNDVLVADRKVAGILLEASWEGAALGWVVAGMGVNVRGAPDVVPGTWPVGALDEAGDAPARELIAERILRALTRHYSSMIEEGPAALVPALAARDALSGRAVRVRLGDAVREGTADGVSEDGALRLRTSGGVESFPSADRLEVLTPA